MYDTRQYTEQMLLGSLILIDHAPHIVDSVSDEAPFELTATNLLTGGHISRIITECDFRSLPCKLGYMNFQFGDIGTTAYITRIPTRSSTNGAQGLTAFNIDITGPHFSNDAINAEVRAKLCIVDSDARSLKRLAKCPGFLSMMRGDYPSVNQACNMLNKGWEAVAIHRDYRVIALDWSPSLCVERRGEKVGICDGGKMRVVDKRFWVSDELSDLGFEVQ